MRVHRVARTPARFAAANAARAAMHAAHVARVAAAHPGKFTFAAPVDPVIPNENLYASFLSAQRCARPQQQP